MRKLFLVAVFALVLAACGGNAEPAPSATASAPTEATDSTPPSTAEATSPEAGEEPPAATAAPDESTEASGPSFDGPPAAAFELALSDGSVFRLSDEQKPVYMVFWAEW